MKQVLVSEQDLQQGIRSMLNEKDTQNVAEIFIERNGEISVVKKAKKMVCNDYLICAKKTVISYTNCAFNSTVIFISSILFST
jgi:uncharacterized membrane protein YcaP (DUF421 family)